jgi:NADH-quinone oxidoreductase subunit K
VIHLAGPVLLASVLAGLGVFGILARRHVIMVLIGAELLLNAVNVLFVAFGSLPAGGLLAAHADPPRAVEPLLAGQSMAIFVITIAAAEIGLALAIVVQLYRARATTNVDEVRELGEGSPSFSGETSGKRTVTR